MKHYCIYTPQLTGPVIADMRSYGVDGDLHLARTRFWLDVEHNIAHAVFFLKYSRILHDISHEKDHQLGV